MLRVTVERERRGWPKRELAQRAHLDQSLIGRVESGRMKPYPGQLSRIARALKSPVRNAAALLEDVSAGQDSVESAAAM